MYHPKQKVMKDLFKIVMIVACLAPVIANAQMVNTTFKVDEFDGKKSYNTERWVRFAQDQTRATLSAFLLLADDGIISLVVYYTSDLGCLSEGRSTIQVKLANDEVVEFTQFSRTDCSNSPSAFFLPLVSDEYEGLTVDELKVLAAERYAMLKEHDWVMIRLRGTEYYTDLKPLKSRNIEYPERFFRAHLASIEKAVAANE